MKSRNESAIRIHPAEKGLRFVTGLLLCLLAVPSLSMATIHYVRAGATGNGSGSDWTNAYPDLPSSLIRGDTYYFAEGTYAPNGHVFNDPENGTLTITLKTATVADHGTDVGWSNSYAGQAKFSQFTFATGYYTFNGVYRTSREGTYGMQVNLNNCGSQCYAFWFLGNDVVNNITIEYVDMPGFGQNTAYDPQYGIYALSGDPGSGGSFSNITVSHCYIHDEGIGGTPIQTNWLTNMTVEYTDFARITSTPDFHAEAWADEGPSSNVTIRYNRFVDIQGTGDIVMLTATPQVQRTDSNWSIYGNVFWQKTAGNYIGTGLVACINGLICSDYYIYNNTIADFGGTQSHNGISWSQANSSSSNIQVYDNLWYNVLNTSPDGPVTSDYNYYINSTGVPSETHIETGSANIFDNLAGGDFHLTTETKDGLHLSSPFDIDPDGVKRGSDNGIWSRGAYQYAPGSASSPQSPSNLTVAGIH